MNIISTFLIVIGITLCSVGKVMKKPTTAKQLRLRAMRKKKRKTILKYLLIIIGICCLPFTSPLILISGFISGMIIEIAKHMRNND